MQKLDFGVGIRVGLVQTKSDFIAAPVNVRPYISGQVYKGITFAGNLDADASGGVERIRFLDVVAQFELDPLFQIWIGRFLPPSDRANLSGPYFQNAWNYPDTVNGFPAIYAGRDEGAAIWGQVGGGRFKYQVGTFSGGVLNSLDMWRYAARLTLNLLDPEPGYYNSSTYYGSKDILAIGAVAQYQRLGFVNQVTNAKDDFVAFSGDILFEKNFGPSSGVLDLEGAVYEFEKAHDGYSAYGLASYLIPGKVAVGQFQPMVRYQNHKLDAGGNNHALDVGVNYVIDGHNLRLALVYVHQELAAGTKVDEGQLGVQFQK